MNSESKQGRVVVVSNRVALPREGKSASGGLAVALRSTLEARGGVWFGWNGRQTTQQRGERPRQQTLNGVEYFTMPLTRRDYEQYYHGFANRMLWPLVHYRLALLRYQRANYEAYRRVNAWFAEMLLDVVKPGDKIWVHDYHHVPLGEELRARGFTGPMGFFLHTPFPPLDILRALPPYREFLRCFAAYDLVGFQTGVDERAFVHAMSDGIGAHVESSSSLVLSRRRTRTGIFPIGSDAEEIAYQAERGRNSPQIASLKASLEGRQMIIGADRLDYSKGIVERFRAYEYLLRTHEELYGEIVFLQIAEPSRGAVPEYQALHRELDQVAGEIIGKYARFDWMPVRYLGRRVPRPTLLAFFSVAGVGLVTPLRDGMNLVAKEFVAAQDPDNPGVLVLSELAGSAAQLSDAVLVNPYDVEGVGEGIAEALTMPLDERRRRWRLLLEAVRGDDIHNWSDNYLDALEGAAAKQKEQCANE